MTAFDPRRAAELLEPRLRHLEREHGKIRGEYYDLMLNGVAPWHRTMHELDSQADAAFDRYWQLKEHIRWLYAEGARRFAPSAAND